MAFWGIEVKPGKPYTHLYYQSRGRLRISQATLGNGKSTSKIMVQCNVGKKAPILLCNLIPEKSETVTLELEFEEDEEVVFSVLGQQSVHLSGFYIGGSGRCLDGDETDSYGEDIAGSDMSGSLDGYDDDEDDEYESDFIDDGDVEMNPRQRKSGVVIEEIIDDEEPPKESSNGNGRLRRLKKMSQLEDSDDANDSKDQVVARKKKSFIVDSEDEDEDGKAVDGDIKMKLDANNGDGINAGKSVETSVPSEVGTENDQKLKSERKRSKKEKKGKKSESDAAVQVENNQDEMKENDETIKSENLDQAPASTEPKKLPTDSEMVDSSVDNSSKKKKRKRKNKENKSLENENNAEVTEQPSNLESGVEADTTRDDTQKEAKKKKKNVEKDSAANKQPVEQKKPDEAKIDSQSKKVQTLPSGLVIEDIALGKPGGKKATSGSKVSVYYTGKLKNGKKFDSNVGQFPFEFKLGKGEVIKGWDEGVKGMTVGGKRRLTIPPSLGYGKKGAGKAIPGNSWLIFDVELVKVR